MVVGVPSSVTIVEEDIHVCELPNSIPDSTAISSNPTEVSTDQINLINELPFEFLSGEELIEHGLDLTDGHIYLTTYRLFIFSNQTPTHCSFINCPIRLIELIELKDNIYLYIHCKDIRSFRVMFFTTDKCCYWLKKLNESISISIGLEDLFAVKYALAKSKPNNDIKRDDFYHEFTRLHLDTDPWRTTEINHDYKLSPTYPNICVIPASITDDEIHEVAKFRSNRRFPTIVWR
jgi:myotubularin-related protein 3/4